jgi:predicted nuclease of restriction endonuclease-like (RecB) superfamily
LAKDLTERFGKGFTERNLWFMRRFYLAYPKLNALRAELAWTHYRTLLRVEDSTARSFYEIECIKNHWSTRELERQITSMLFERLALSKDKKKVMQLAKRGQVIETPEDMLKNPYVLEFVGLPEKSHYTESQLEQALIDHLQEFLLELGKGFTFAARQMRITIDNEHYYIDLVLFHRILRCLVLFDLKMGKITHADIGQMNFYLNYVKKHEQLEGENDPIGIILGSDMSEVFVEYALGGIDNKIFVSKYQLYLPSKEQLQRMIKKELELLEKNP